MSAYVDILFALLWIVALSVALVFVARRFFHEPRRAEVVAGIVVVAFVAGAAWSNATHPAAAIDATPTVGIDATNAAPVTLAAGGPVDVSDRCRAVAHLAAVPGGFGAIDAMSIKEPSAAPAQGAEVAQGAVVSGASGLAIHGWGGDISTNAPAAAACLVVDGHIDVTATSRYFQDRSDVAATFHKDALARSGFEIDVAPRSIPTGPHRISVALESSDGTLALARTSWSIVVR